MSTEKNTTPQSRDKGSSSKRRQEEIQCVLAGEARLKKAGDIGTAATITAEKLVALVQSNPLPSGRS
jgi:hypothetical protein